MCLNLVKLEMNLEIILFSSFQRPNFKEFKKTEKALKT
jgi:hypothetical protein